MKNLLLASLLISAVSAAPMAPPAQQPHIGLVCRPPPTPGNSATVQIQNSSPFRAMDIYRINQDCSYTLVTVVQSKGSVNVKTNVNAQFVAKKHGEGTRFDFLEVKGSATWKIQEPVTPFNINQLIQCSEMKLNGKTSFFCTLVDPQDKQSFSDSMKMITSKAKEVGGALAHPFVSLAKFVFHHNSITWAFNVLKDPKKAASYTFKEGKAWGNFAIGAGKTIAAIPLQLAEIAGSLVILQYDIYILMHQCILLFAKSTNDIQKCKDRWMDPTQIMWTPRLLQVNNQNQEAGAGAAMIGTMFIDPAEASSAITTSVKRATSGNKLVIPTVEGEVKLSPVQSYSKGNALSKPLVSPQDVDAAKNVLDDSKVVLTPCTPGVSVLKKRMMGGDFCYDEFNSDYFGGFDPNMNLQNPDHTLTDTYDGVTADPTVIQSIQSLMTSIDSNAQKILSNPNSAYNGYEVQLRNLRSQGASTDDIINYIKQQTGVTLTADDVKTLNNYVNQMGSATSYSNLFKKWPKWNVAQDPVFRITKLDKNTFNKLSIGQQVPMKELAQGRDYLAASRTKFIERFREDQTFEMVINCKDCKWIAPLSTFSEDEVIVQAPALTYLGRKQVQIPGAGKTWRLYFNQPAKVCAKPPTASMARLCI